MAVAIRKIEDKSKDHMRALSLTLLICCLAGLGSSYAQTNKLVRKGNKLYQEKKYPEAVNAYTEALNKNPANMPGMFNLGNALFQQKNYNAARQVMASTAKGANDKQLKAGANYNIGNTYMQEQKWEEAIDAYKKALRVNPQDEAAKYNLSYAQAMMKKQQGGGGKNKDKNKDQQQNKDNQQNKDDKNKDQKNQDQQNKDGKDDQKEQQKQDQQKQEDQSQHPQPQPSKLTEKQAEQLLNALQQEEKKLQDKKQKGKGIPVKVDKDW